VSDLEWISVEDRLPEEHDIVDVYCSDGRNTEIEFYDGGFYGPEQDFSVDDCGYGCLSNTDLINDVTHWMPLPEPPTDTRGL